MRRARTAGLTALCALVALVAILAHASYLRTKRDARRADVTRRKLTLAPTRTRTKKPERFQGLVARVDAQT